MSLKEEESEKADLRVQELEQRLADKRAQNAQKRIALQGKQKTLSDLKLKNASVDVNALTATFEKAKLSIQEKSDQNQTLRDQVNHVQVEQGEFAMNNIIAEAALEEVEQENAQKAAKLEDVETNLAEQLRLVKNTATDKMKERTARIKEGNQNLAVALQAMADEGAENERLLDKQKAQLQNIGQENQQAKKKLAQSVAENMKLAKGIEGGPKLVIDRQKEIDELKVKLEVIKQEAGAVRKETKDACHKRTKKMKKEQRRQAFLGIMSETSSTVSDIEPFDANISSSMGASDIVVNLPKVDMNETNDALEQMKRYWKASQFELSIFLKFHFYKEFFTKYSTKSWKTLNCKRDKTSWIKDFS